MNATSNDSNNNHNNNIDIKSRNNGITMKNKFNNKYNNYKMIIILINKNKSDSIKIIKNNNNKLT